MAEKHSKRRRRGERGLLHRIICMAAIGGCVIGAMTLFFRVRTVVITGTRRYSIEEVRRAAGVEDGDNLLLFDKYHMGNRIIHRLPYIEQLHIHRTLPDTLRIEVQECSTPMALNQDGSTWLISPGGKIVDQLPETNAPDYGVISGCKLLAPEVGANVVLDTESTYMQNSLLDLLAALGQTGMIDQTNSVRMDDPTCIRIDYAGRFTVRLLYGADYVYKLRALALYLNHEKIQENMSGTFDMTRDDRNYFQQDVR